MKTDLDILGDDDTQGEALTVKRVGDVSATDTPDSVTELGARVPPPTQPRRFVQIAATGGANTEDFLYALADDGTVWRLPGAHTATLVNKWRQLRSAPQPAGD